MFVDICKMSLFLWVKLMLLLAANVFCYWIRGKSMLLLFIGWRTKKKKKSKHLLFFFFSDCLAVSCYCVLSNYSVGKSQISLVKRSQLEENVKCWIGMNSMIEQEEEEVQSPSTIDISNISSSSIKNSKIHKENQLYSEVQPKCYIGLGNNCEL